mgnify:CR=1 FL=1|jgi:uncharacterized OsmC-like protein
MRETEYLLLGTLVVVVCGYYFATRDFLTRKKITETEGSSADTESDVTNLTTRWSNKFDGESPTKSRHEVSPTFSSVVLPGRHTVVIESGSSGAHMTPMQALVAAAASCYASGILKELELKCTVLDIEIKSSKKGQHLAFHVVVTSPNAALEMVNQLCINYRCEVLRTLDCVITITCSIKKFIEI